MTSSTNDKVYLIFDTNFIRKNEKSPETFDEFYIHRYDELEKLIERCDLGANVFLLIPEIVMLELTIQKKSKLKSWVRNIEDYSNNFSEFKEFLNKAKLINVDKHIDDIKEKRFSNVEVIPLPPNREQLFDNILERALKKTAPFRKDESDKGFKDSILFLSLIYYAKDFTNSKFVLFSNDSAFSHQDQRETLESEFSQTGNILEIRGEADIEGYVKALFGIEIELPYYITQEIVSNIEEEIQNYKKIRINQNEFEIKSIDIDTKSTYREDISATDAKIVFAFIVEYVVDDTVLILNNLTREYIINKPNQQVVSKGEYNYGSYKNKPKYSQSWKNSKISDIGVIVGGGTPSTIIEKYYGGNIPWITPKNLSNYNMVYIGNGDRSITEEGLANSAAKLMPEGTVLFTSRAPIGYVAIAKNKLSTNQGFKNIICNRHAYNRFIYYWLIYNKDYIEKFASGSTFKEISGGVLGNIEIKLPPYHEQKEIADLLFSLDTKIELNQKVNINLQKISKVIFKRWFIDYEFPNQEGLPYRSSGGKMIDSEMGKIPHEWRVDKLGNHSIIKGRIGWKGLQVSEYIDDGPYIVGGKQLINDHVDWDGCPMVPQKRYEESPNIMLKEDDILMTKDGTIGKLAIIDKILSSSTVASGIFVIRSHSPLINQMYLWHYFKSDIFKWLVESRIEGSVVPHLYQRDITEMQFVLPTSQVTSQFEIISRQLWQKIHANSAEIGTLTKIRDSLLPKLMTGKIRVPMEVT